MGKRIVYTSVPDGWTRVILTIEGGRAKTSEMTIRVHNWMHNQDGLYALCGIVDGSFATENSLKLYRKMDFRFENPDTAFAFKMRWG